MAFGFGSFGGSLLGALGMPQTGGVTGQPSVDPGQLGTAPSTDSTGAPVDWNDPNRSEYMPGNPIWPGQSTNPGVPGYIDPNRPLPIDGGFRGGEPMPGWGGGNLFPFQPQPGMENPGGQTMPPAAGGVFGGGVHTGGQPWDTSMKPDEKQPGMGFRNMPPWMQRLGSVRASTMPMQPQPSMFSSFADMVRQRMGSR